jgi:hypothetical protein
MNFNEVISFVYDHHNHHTKQWNNLLLSPIQLERYAAATTNKGASTDTNCFGFVDRTVKAICRPSKQRLVYNGHKRHHALKFQSVVTPNGMIANLYGPVGNCINKNTF